MMNIQTKRAYAPPSRNDGKRILVDGIWPRGKTREELNIDDWDRAVAPSADLRRWFGHDPNRWDEFRRRYDRELDHCRDAWEPLAEVARHGKLTLVFGAKDEEHNNAVALKGYLERHLRKGPEKA